MSPPPFLLGCIDANSKQMVDGKKQNLYSESDPAIEDSC